MEAVGLILLPIYISKGFSLTWWSALLARALLSSIVSHALKMRFKCISSPFQVQNFVHTLILPKFSGV